LLLAEYAQPRCAEMLRLAVSLRTSIWNVEASRYAATHAELGGYLLALWGLPEFLVDVCVHHHRPSLSDDTAFGVLTAVHVANAWSSAWPNQNIGAFAVESPLDEVYLQRIGCADRLSFLHDAIGVAGGQHEVLA
jgi:HD-like signal output (HDOD) protein